MSPTLTMTIGDRHIGRVSLGGARWSITDPADDAPAEAILERALDAGVDLIDTARAYTTRDEESHNERLIARVLKRRGESRVLVATKGGHFRDGDDYPIDASPAALRRDCQRSLDALGREAHDLYYLHHPDPRVPFEDSVGTLAELRTAGLAVRIGLCNVTVDQLRSAREITRIDAIQNRHGVLAPADAGLLQECTDAGIAFFGYSPLAGVDLTEPGSTVLSAAALRGMQPTSILLAWLLSAGENVGVLTGARRAATLDASLAAAAVQLDPTEIDAIGVELASIAR
ncbi:aldo/keto reductase [Microbacterium sp. Root61]|uniref:aldo/keto reductase n=1 Tax=Microbacterium sp. Root61 TaxID=1736570 RepID=UPI0009E99876|nr:aldo/keto reductase [Microbacterium sp. Root61]